MLVAWIAVITCAVASGCLLCAALVVRRRPWTYGAGSAAFLSSAIAAVVLASRSGARLETPIVASLIAVGALIGGFLLGSSLVPALTRSPETRSPPATRIRISHGIAVALVSEGQPETYEPAVMTQAFELLTSNGVPVPAEALRVLSYATERTRYRGRGPSPARPVLRAVGRDLATSLGEQGLQIELEQAWLQGTPRLSDAVLVAADAGSDSLVIVHAGVAETMEYERARREADRQAVLSGVRLSYASPLWSEKPLARLVCDRVLQSLGEDVREEDGAMLVGLGQPWQWDRARPSTGEHETFFLQRVRSMLVSAGLEESHVRPAWLDWQDPGVTEVVRHLAALGCTRIVAVPATVPADTLETLIDLPAAIEQAALDPSTELTILPAWGNDPVFSAVLADVTLRTAREAGLLAGQ